jgi:O-antigen/teichoic acid export membrane protein
MEIAKLRLWVVRGSIISIAPAVEFGSRFARTVILSRLLSQDEFGISVAITVVLGMASLVTDVALDKFALIQADDSAEEALSAGHLLSLIRGALISVALLAGAPLAARVFGVPQCAESFAVAALVPLITSFGHLKIKQIQRHYDYAPETWSIMFSNVTAIIALVVAIPIFKDHRAIVVSFLIEAASYVVASHYFAQARYRINANRELIRRALAFGVPLMLNGIGLALITQADRVLVGTWFGVDMLARYSVLLSISVVPISLVLRVFGTMSLSFILSHASKGRIDTDRCGILVFFFAVLASLYSLLIAVCLDWVSPNIFGHSFQVDPSAHLLLTLIVFLRLQRGGAPTNLLLATGRTRELALLNLSTAAGLAIACVLVFLSPHFQMLLLGLAIGDMLSLLLFLFASTAIVRLSLSWWLVDVVAAFGVLTVILGMLAYQANMNLTERLMLFGVGVTGVAVQIVVGLWIHRSFFNRSDLSPDISSKVE